MELWPIAFVGVRELKVLIHEGSELDFLTWNGLGKGQLRSSDSASPQANSKITEQNGTMLQDLNCLDSSIIYHMLIFNAIDGDGFSIQRRCSPVPEQTLA